MELIYLLPHPPPLHWRCRHWRCRHPASTCAAPPRLYSSSRLHRRCASPPPTGDAREGRGRWIRQGGGGMVVAGGGGHCHYRHHHLRRHHLRSRLCHRQQCGGGGRWRRVFIDFVVTAPVRPVGTVSLTVLLEDSSNPPFHGFLGRVVDLALYKTKVLGLKPPPGGLSTNPQLTFVTFAPVSVHSPHISPY
jgi:hypothetical protein